MTFEEIRKDIKARKYKPIYFLCGEEPFFIDRLTALLENTVLTEDEKAFNQTVLYGARISLAIGIVASLLNLFIGVIYGEKNADGSTEFRF